jgi:ribosomal protein S18 acetylase RimI-like enzyme
MGAVITHAPLLSVVDSYMIMGIVTSASQWGKTMKTITYRPFSATDGDAVFAVAQAAWHFTYAAIFDPAFIDQFTRTNYAPERLNALAPLVATQEIFFDVAVDGDQVIGFCNMGLTPQGAQLFRIYLHPSAIGQGIGAALLQRGEEFVRARGLTTYSCFVHSRNELGKRFYERQGFRHRAELDQEEEWYMEKQLA